MAEEIKLEGECSHRKGAAIDVDNAEKRGNDVVVDADDLAESIKKELYTKFPRNTDWVTIFQVPQAMRNQDHAAYTPKVVTFGPFHRLRQHPLTGQWYPPLELQHMENLKWFYLGNVLRRSKHENDFDKCIKKMKENASQAQDSYSGNFQMNPEEFIKMMVLDGGLTIEHLLQLEHGSGNDDPIYSDRWTLPCIAHDMLLLENQLPFFVLERLWELTGQSSSDLKKSVLKFFRNLLPEKHDLELPKGDVYHLLHLMHLSLQPTSPTKKPESTSGTTLTCSPKTSGTLSAPKNSLFESPEPLQPTSSSKISQHSPLPIFTRAELLPHDQLLFAFGPYQTPPGQQISDMSEPRPPPPPKTIPSVTELHEAGVKFLRDEDARSYLDITFEQGLMKIPRLTISDSTNSLFRNFIAFEQSFPACGSHFTSYCIFMDSLINTPRDVQFLSQFGIIEHVLGSDDEVALLFNKLCRGITWDFKNSYLAKVSEEVIQHSQKRWPTWRAKLVRDYFSNPWTIISLIAAIMILLLTFLQTYFAVLSYFRPP